MPAVLRASDLTDTSHRLDDLEPGTDYWVHVRCNNLQRSSTTSDLVRFRTRALGTDNLVTYRVSEYHDDDVDLLRNHNGGDLLGEATFIGDSGNFESKDLYDPSNSCIRALSSACGQFFKPPATTERCGQCAVDAWHNQSHPGHAAVRAECSDPAQPFPLDNKLATAFCDVERGGSGFFSFERTPIAEYCVEKSAATGSGASDGFADYSSCNAPEAGSLNDPKDPICICACFADRLIAHQNVSTVSPHCGNPQHGYPQCNCSTAPGREATLLPASSPALRFVGRQPVWCPYYYYDTAQPQYDRRLSSPCGYWYAFPKGGECSASERPSSLSLSAQSSSLCTWRREPTALVHVLYGTDLLAAGWDKSPSFDQKTGVRLNTTAQTFKNAQVLKRVLDARRRKWFSQSRCCGC